MRPCAMSKQGEPHMRKTCLEMVHTLARRDERVMFIGSDLGPGVMDSMRREMPARCLMEGISEAAIIGVAAGLAMDGYIPYLNTIATFLTRRAFEQIALDVCLHRLPVRLIGNGGGLVYAPLGPTHIANDDFALMGALPHMTVAAPCDAAEMRRLMEASLDWPDPIYIRLAKGGDKIVSREDLPFTLGKAIPLLMPEKADVLFITTGVMTQEAIEAAKQLDELGIAAKVLHCPTVKPLDQKAILEAASDVRVLVVAEEHLRIGGLGSAVLDILMSTNRADMLPVFRHAALPDAFISNYGSQRQNMEQQGLTCNTLAEMARVAIVKPNPS